MPRGKKVVKKVIKKKAEPTIVKKTLRLSSDSKELKELSRLSDRMAMPESKVLKHLINNFQEMVDRIVELESDNTAQEFTIRELRRKNIDIGETWQRLNKLMKT